MLYYFLGSPPPLWGQGARGRAGSKESELGARGASQMLYANQASIAEEEIPVRSILRNGPTYYD